MSIEQFASDVQAKYGSGLATEHTYRTELENLMTSIGGENTQAINEPKRSGGNAPDFYVARDLLTIGFIEAKDLDKNLTVIENDEQLTRYRSAYRNLLLTNHLEFRWYVDGESVDSVTIGTLDGKNIRFDTEAYPKLEGILRRYYEATAPTIYKPEDLAERMAKLARELARLIEEALENPIEGSDLPAKKEAVEQVLIPNMTNRQFADMFAQTIAYGLFAARARFTGKPENFTLEKAFFELPKTNPFLKKLFQNLASELDKRVKHMADLIAQLLAYAKGLDDMIANFGHSTKRQDPVIHFYETFLSAYDPSQREKRGVYYTPEPVVSYIVRSVDYILKTTFGRTEGLADEETLILDPATGTGTFLYQVIQQIHDSMAGNMGVWKSYVQKHLLPRIFGFELLMAPYTVAHMKLNLLLGELGYDFEQNDRLEIYLTNSLEENVQQPSLPFAEYLTDEANAATEVKSKKDIMVVLGNPPYSVSSTNNSVYIEQLMETYKKAVRSERNIQPLSDDYIKFIRFAHDRIERTGYGILSFVTNHVYLFGLIHRGMRQELMKFFDEIYVLNLHGNSIIKETTPNGNNDQNVFDIRQGVAIVIFVKKEHNIVQNDAKVFYDDLWGTRKEKYLRLSQLSIQNTNWEQLNPVSPYYFFIPTEFSLKPEYDTYSDLKDIFGFNGGAVKTRRDYLLVEFDKDELIDRIKDVLVIENPEILKTKYGIEDTKYWNISEAKLQISKTSVESKVFDYSYRPFDIRQVYYNSDIIERGDARTPVMRHILEKNNLLLGIGRQGAAVDDDIWYLMTVSKNLTDMNIFRRGGVNIFPLYLYPEKKTDQLFELDDDGSAWQLSAEGRRPNLNPEFIAEMSSKLGLTFITEGQGDLIENFAPEDVFHYAYAVFHSPTYRERYAEFLKIDFPRLPLTSDRDLFRTLCKKGEELVQWHLMTHPDIAKTDVTFPIAGSGEVISRHPRYDEETERVYINNQQYFADVPQDVWEFHIGGYQVLDKWLKDRKGRELDFKDVRHYQRIVKALQATMTLMDEIDEAIPSFPIV